MSEQIDRSESKDQKDGKTDKASALKVLYMLVGTGRYNRKRHGYQEEK